MSDEISTVNPLDKFVQAFIDRSEEKNSVRIEAERQASLKRKMLISAALKLSTDLDVLKSDYKKSLLSSDMDSASIKSRIMCKQQELDVNFEIQTELFGTAVIF